MGVLDQKMILYVLLEGTDKLYILMFHFGELVAKLKLS